MVNENYLIRTDAMDRAINLPQQARGAKKEGVRNHPCPLR